MNKQSLFRRLSAVTLAAVLTVGALPPLTAFAAAIPAKVAVQTGKTVLANDKASVDASNLAEGFVSVKYTGGKNVRIKVRITKEGSGNYDYDLNNGGVAETFPLTEGNGTYSISILENTSGTKYASAHSCKVSLVLRSEMAPYLYPNQYVNFTADSKTAKKAAELVAGKTAELDKVAAIFDYVVDNFTYDYEFAKEVTEGKHVGYLPTVDKTLDSKKGICFDYAAVMAAMLRSQGIPCKLVVGYAGEIYHAWINVYISGSGWVDKVIKFDGKSWTLMDPTFTSSGARSDSIMKYVTTASNYKQRYAY